MDVYEVMLRSLIKSLRVAASYAGNNIIISNIMTTINSNKFDDCLSAIIQVRVF